MQHLLGNPKKDSSGHNINFNYISLFFILFGAFIRLNQYLNNRSLWHDEASVALNIVNRSYLELLRPLDYNQAAPPGFLWIERLAVQLFGDSEYSLRLFPLAASIISLVAFYQLANRYASKTAAPIAIALFACLRYPVYYATEVKQYSSDIMVTLLLCLLLVPASLGEGRRNREEGGKGRGKFILLGLLGAIAIWLSHPAVFVLAGIELSSLVCATANRRKLFLNRLPIYLVWLISFGCLYVLTIANTMNNESLVDSWSDRFPDSPFDIIWLLDALGRFFYRPLGFGAIADGVAMVAFVLGCIATYRKNRSLLLALTSPLIVTLIASYLHKYPFRDRLVLFLAPLAIVIIAEGISFLLTHFRQYMPLVGIVITIILLVPPLVRTSQLVTQPEAKEEIRPVIEYIRSHQQPGDSLYVYPKGITQFLYYAPKYGYETGYRLGEHELPEEREAQAWEPFRQDIAPLQGKQRVWFLFSSATETEEELLVSYLNRLGQQLDYFQQPEAFVYLYSLQGI